MIKYFCDRCGAEIDKHNTGKDILQLDCTPKYFYPMEWDGKPWHRLLCNGCFVAFDEWMEGGGENV